MINVRTTIRQRRKKWTTLLRGLLQLWWQRRHQHLSRLLIDNDKDKYISNGDSNAKFRVLCSIFAMENTLFHFEIQNSKCSPAIESSFRSKSCGFWIHSEEARERTAEKKSELNMQSIRKSSRTSLWHFKNSTIAHRLYWPNDNKSLHYFIWPNPPGLFYKFINIFKCDRNLQTHAGNQHHLNLPFPFDSLSKFFLNFNMYEILSCQLEFILSF